MKIDQSNLLCRGGTLAVLLLALQFHAACGEGEDATLVKQTQEEGEVEPADAILFPFFILALGIIAYRLLSRYLKWLPYTGFMFVLGTCIGVGVTRIHGKSNLLNESILNFWIPIDSELLLVSFLPGLVYKDASGQNPHLFRVAFAQCLIFAFPMVLAGTVLTALVAYYIFPYDWSFNLAMTFGSILSATDPVAVAALLEQVGAPPRLKVHIAGESLLNDGSAIVFFSIFSGSYLLELGVEGLGEQVNGAQGVNQFFRKSVGGMCIGIFFGAGLITILYLLNRRLEREENVTQVGATITLAYLCYFVADVAWGTSGVMAVVAMGVMTTTLGGTYINDPKLMEDFWSIVEWLLNTVLFALGGLVWGSIIGNTDEEFPDRRFTGKDWGYLLLLYILLTAIRFILLVCFYPVVSRIGLGSSWKELIFESYGGLRGAVGISLAIFLDNIVRENADGSDLTFVLQTNKLFGFVGGIAFLSLMVNGVFAGPLLHYLRLTDTTDTRKHMLKCYVEHNRQNAVRELVELLGERRFSRVNFAVVRFHVPFLEDTSPDEVIEAAQLVYSVHDASSETGGKESLVRLDSFLKYTKRHSDDVEGNDNASSPRFILNSKKGGQKHRDSLVGDRVIEKSTIPQAIRGKRELTVTELRRLFLELVRAGYQKQIEDGELVDREFLVVALTESLELAAESVERVQRLNDWDFVFLVRYPSVYTIKFAQGEVGKYFCCDKIMGCCGLSTLLDADTVRVRLDTEKCLAFIQAHTTAQATMKDYFANDKHLALLQERIIGESEAEVKLAEAHLQQFDEVEVELVISHKVCKILLNNSVRYCESLVEKGLLKEREASDFFEKVQQLLLKVDSCGMKIHSHNLAPKNDVVISRRGDLDINDTTEMTRPTSARIETKCTGEFETINLIEDNDPDPNPLK
ncbi:hypothetical protein ACA910_003869 [Epithemia clementina (nom. ined.)]